MHKEEIITKTIIKWLVLNNWSIVCYDFPQSGTGILLKSNNRDNVCQKNKGGVIPDIIAVKNENALFFENKSYTSFADIQKILSIKEHNDYSEALKRILAPYSITSIYYGLGLPKTSEKDPILKENTKKLDFVLLVDNYLSVSVFHDNLNIF